MNLYVVRHGQTDVNLENKINSINDDDLNKTGIEEAKNLKNVFSNINYDLIICSPLTRTKHTAKLLNVINAELIFDKRLIERDAGILTKQSLDNIDSNDWWNVYPKNDYKDAETVHSVIKRIYSFLDELKIKYINKNIVLVTHGGVSKVIRSYFDGIPEDGNLEKYSHKNCEVKTYEIIQ